MEAQMITNRKGRAQSLGEEIGNAVTHGAGFVFGIVALILMLVKADAWKEYVGVSLFGAGLMMLYVMSCLYHAFRNGSKVKLVFRRFDHLSIYVLIAGTFAPILLNVVSQPLGLIFFIIQWVVVTVGVVLKAIDPARHGKLHVLCYLLLGWSGLFLGPQLLHGNQTLFLLILSGGIAYSIGVIFYAAHFKYAHFIWHFFCLFGSILHFIAIYSYIL